MAAPSPLAAITLTPGRVRENRRMQFRPLVVVLDHTAELGGAELALVRLIHALDPGSADVVAWLFSPGPLANRLRDDGIPVRILPLGRAATRDRHEVGGSIARAAATALGVLPFSSRLAAHLTAARPDLVYATSLKAGLIAIPVARALGIPAVWHLHDRISPDYLPTAMVRLIRLVAGRLATAVIVNSEATAATLPEVSSVVAYPGFGPDQVGGAPPHRLQPEPPVVGILGRISATKGQVEFVNAAARVHRAHPAARFRIIGSAMFDQAEYEQRVRSEVRRLGLADVVEFTGFVDDPIAALDALTLCVHASPVPEPFGQVVVEAMIRGVPVVATRGGGVDEIMTTTDDQALGWLVEAGDVAGLAAAIREALDDPAEARRRAEAAWVSARERFPIGRTAAIVSRVWQRVARGRGRQPVR